MCLPPGLDDTVVVCCLPAIPHPDSVGGGEAPPNQEGCSSSHLLPRLFPLPVRRGRPYRHKKRGRTRVDPTPLPGWRGQPLEAFPSSPSTSSSWRGCCWAGWALAEFWFSSRASAAAWRSFLSSSCSSISHLL